MIAEKETSYYVMQSSNKNNDFCCQKQNIILVTIIALKCQQLKCLGGVT